MYQVYYLMLAGNPKRVYMKPEDVHNDPVKGTTPYYIFEHGKAKKVYIITSQISFAPPAKKADLKPENQKEVPREIKEEAPKEAPKEVSGKPVKVKKEKPKKRGRRK